MIDGKFIELFLGFKLLRVILDDKCNYDGYISDI